jgi:hypothetical protein
VNFFFEYLLNEWKFQMHMEDKETYSILIIECIKLIFCYCQHGRHGKNKTPQEQGMAKLILYRSYSGLCYLTLLQMFRLLCQFFHCKSNLREQMKNIIWIWNLLTQVQHIDSFRGNDVPFWLNICHNWKFSNLLAEVTV